MKLNGKNLRNGMFKYLVSTVLTGSEMVGVVESQGERGARITKSLSCLWGRKIFSIGGKGVTLEGGVASSVF